MPPNLPTAARILAVEEDSLLASQLQIHLQRNGHSVTLCEGGNALLLAERGNFDLILLAILGPDGLGVLEQLRRRSQVPVMLMSALGDEQNRIAGFNMGADDYLSKPFSIVELGVRVAAILRRVAYERQESVPQPGADELSFDEVHGDVMLTGNRAGLTASEYRVLQLLHQHMDQVLSKPLLYQQALRRGYARHDRSLDMHISHLRRKLQVIGYRAARLETVWGQGYMLACSDA
ncbi:response regulator transcription factor [Pseudomonas sp. FME51]|uniref:response regulator transcription factor n=1 Tax=Pseudomonas sp. FME51 TaxID=2742609 RepID=UPI0018670329